MESLGEKLKNTREEKGLTYDQVGRETHIASRYLEALEAEDFSKFPGEPYVQGFLRNYGSYL
ncbi:MAG: helix-turn-helix domain-containing protein, partial [Spirochaetaceae bacterium]|nr:helix-turn-helix domain-containing protein [Spirochaetaceae bacterium]